MVAPGIYVISSKSYAEFSIENKRIAEFYSEKYPDKLLNDRDITITHSAPVHVYDTGRATLIDLGGGSVPNGDGLLLEGKTLYVMQNRLNQIGVVQLNPELTAGEIVGTITDAAFDVPTTIAGFGNAIYAVNARFGTPPTPDTEYDIIRVIQ